jgi:hypothetical protein
MACQGPWEPSNEPASNIYVVRELSINRLRVCLGLYLRNRVFKQKKLLDKSFIFKLLSKMLLIFFLSNDYIYFSSNGLFEC